MVIYIKALGSLGGAGREGSTASLELLAVHRVLCCVCQRQGPWSAFRLYLKRRDAARSGAEKGKDHILLSLNPLILEPQPSSLQTRTPNIFKAKTWDESKGKRVSYSSPNSRMVRSNSSGAPDPSTSPLPRPPLTQALLHSPQPTSHSPHGWVSPQRGAEASGR